MSQRASPRLAGVSPDFERILTHGGVDIELPHRFTEAQISCETVRVTMRDGVKLATDVYRPPALPAPAIVIRTPYGRAAERYVPIFKTFTKCGYVVISQDCRGTGDSEPEVWDYCVYEDEDGFDFVDWVSQQTWFNGFLASFGGSYVGMTQWCMAMHPRMSAIAPEVAGLRIVRNTVRQHMLVNAYPRVIGKGAGRLQVPITQIERLIEAETMSGGCFNEPLPTPIPEAVFEQYPALRTVPLSEAKRTLWAQYCVLPAAKRVTLLKALLGAEEITYTNLSSLPTCFDSLIPYAFHTIRAVDLTQLSQRFHAPALILAAWYDWNLGDVLPSWVTLRREGGTQMSERSRLIIAPSAHNSTGYREGAADHPELQHDHRNNVALLLRWYQAVRDGATDAWPRVIYYLMGANEWRTATDWPVPETKPMALYLGSQGTLSAQTPQTFSQPDCYTYDPAQPTPTIGGSILSFLYTPGSVDVAEVQQRADVLTYTTEPLLKDLDVVGPLRLILYASSSALDTDFSGRLSDVFPDGRAIQLQSGMLRARYRNLAGDPQRLEPGRIYRFEIDLWATANRFKAGHRLRVDISSADFPRFDRNDNRGGESGEPVAAHQSIYHDPEHPSHLLIMVDSDSTDSIS